jgi:hypothetical protein
VSTLRDHHPWRLGGLLAAVALTLTAVSPTAIAAPNSAFTPDVKQPPVSGVAEFRTADGPAATTLGAAATAPAAAAADAATSPTGCPQAGLDPRGSRPSPDVGDAVERLGGRGDDVRVNREYSCFPQNETSIAVNPVDPRNLVGGANDYRLGWGSSGVYASTDGGRTWVDRLIPFPSLPNGDNLDGGGDPVVVFDRTGVAYYLEINFNRTDDTNGIFVSRSTDGGFTWSRHCVALPTDPPACGPAGDPRTPGDGVVIFTPDDDPALNGSVPFSDKPWMAAGPRPEGVEPACFDALTRDAVPCAEGTVTDDRLYVTWTVFADDSQIYLSHSDDGARSWSPPRSISGSAPFCVGGEAAGGGPDDCNTNQFSVPTVSPATGELFIAWVNFNTVDENQYVVVRSSDGGATFTGPRFVTTTFDANYPRAGDPAASPALTRPDCTARGQQTSRAVLTNSCFRVNSAGNVVVDKRGGAYADDLYLVLSDNRNGTRESSNTDVFLMKSTDGGETWLGPTRVNDDRSEPAGDRDCAVGSAGCAGDLGTDQWFPWVDIGTDGELNVVFSDRRLDTSSTASEWPDSRSRPGNYLVWHSAAQCRVDDADSRECVADEAEVVTQPTGPVDPGPGPVPGQAQAEFPFRNAVVSDVPSNFDYGFRAGIFLGDYNNVAVAGDHAVTLWTDARNGRSSRNQPGRNPACEQADAFLEVYDATRARSDARARPTDALFAVTPCPVS